ncbi:catalase [Enterovibrio calviensis]|uniref:catalase n=1 Tax=Enterovibrio calviensis TaxID=91359 RepID=UPI00373573C3
MNKSILCAAALGLVASPTIASPNPNLAVDSVDVFESIFGITEGKRRNHTKGFCFEGRFEPIATNITRYTNSPLFQASTKVIGRLSHKGGNIDAPDDVPSDYGLGLSMQDVNGGITRMAVNTLDFFPVSTPEAFLELNQATLKGKEALAAVKEKYPEIKAFKAHMAKRDNTLKPYEDISYNSVNSFYLVNDQGEKVAFRFAFVPTSKHDISVETGSDFYFENLQKSLESGEVSWNMVVTIANPQDMVDDAAKRWEGEHVTFNAARLVIESITPEGKCEDITFDPTMLSDGIEPSNDPLLQTRSSSYAVGLGRRLSEKSQ